MNEIKTKKRILFYLVHPSKFHLFRITINELKKKHKVDIIINSKDVLEDLIKNEGWGYYNIFPKGRNTSNKPSIIKSGLKFVLTLIKLELFLIKKEKYDIFVTDDSLVVNGWIRNKTSYIFNDNDISTIKINKILFYFATKIISPASTDLGKFEEKKISFKGNKALAHLHPSYFSADASVLKKYELEKNKFCLIRVAKLNATHDVNNNEGILDRDIEKIIDLINNRIKIVIISERKLPLKFEKMKFKGNPSDIPSLLSFARFLISDSGTMATEAAVLGTPNILINRLAKDIGVHKELSDFGLQYFYEDISYSFNKIKNFISNEHIKKIFMEKRNKYIEKCDDINKLFLNLFEGK